MFTKKSKPSSPEFQNKEFTCTVSAASVGVKPVCVNIPMSHLERGTPLCSCQDCQWWCRTGTSQPSSRTSAHPEPTSQRWSLRTRGGNSSLCSPQTKLDLVRGGETVSVLLKLMWGMISLKFKVHWCTLLTIVFSSEDLRCNVVGCSTKSTGSIAWSDALLSGRRRRRK